MMTSILAMTRRALVNYRNCGTIAHRERQDIGPGNGCIAQFL
jgi:hypothetical protein